MRLTAPLDRDMTHTDSRWPLISRPRGRTTSIDPLLRGPMKTLTLAAFAIVLTACATTPAVMLKNDATGQIARCGGNTTNLGAPDGPLAYQLREADDEQCIKDYEAQGFHRIQ